MIGSDVRSDAVEFAPAKVDRCRNSEFLFQLPVDEEGSMIEIKNGDIDGCNGYNGYIDGSIII